MCWNKKAEYTIIWTTNPATWAGTSWQHGAAPVWGTPTYDPVLDMVYFSTGNAWPDFYGGERAGTNLYASSILALDATSGELQLKNRACSGRNRRTWPRRDGASRMDCKRR
jgi:glucose dehydrogenase